jgi:hypothetical protein
VYALLSVTFEVYALSALSAGPCVVVCTPIGWGRMSSSDSYAGCATGMAEPGPGPSGRRRPDGPRAVSAAAIWSRINDAKSWNAAKQRNEP